jgi:hypothetical protein
LPSSTWVRVKRKTPSSKPMAFKWAGALCESMKPKNARLADPGVAVAAAAAVVVAGTVVVEAVAVETAAAVAAVHAAGNPGLKLSG